MGLVMVSGMAGEGEAGGKKIRIVPRYRPPASPLHGHVFFNGFSMIYHVLMALHW